jgi:serine/threonine-protein kinase HipA
LPEAKLREYVAARGGIDTRNDFGLLWITGDDLPGAVAALDPEGRVVPPPAMGGPSFSPSPDTVYRFSLAGVQLKFSAAHNAQGGLTVPVSGVNGNFIAKLPSAHFDNVPLNEYAMMRFAADLGIDVPDCSLVPIRDVEGLPSDLNFEPDQQVFVIRRFDRVDGQDRVHIEDFNQIYRQYPESKYKNRDYTMMARDIYRLIGMEALQDFVRRLVFTVAIGNTDMHLKNWSVIYRDGRTPSLAPGYDYLCTSVYRIHGRDELALDLGGVKEFTRISDESFEHLAARAGVSQRIVLTTAREMRARILDAWPQMRALLRDEWPPLYDRIEEMLTTVPFFSHKAAPRLAGENSKHEELA